MEMTHSHQKVNFAPLDANQEELFLCTQPQVLLVEIEKAVAFIQTNKSSFDIMGKVTSTAKNQRRTKNG